MRLKLSAVVAACIAATSSQAQEFPSTNEEHGCVLLSQLTATKASREECRGFIASVKKNDDALACVVTAAMMRAARLNEAPSRRPLGLSLSMMEACEMMASGASAERARAVTEKMCAQSRDPDFVRDCRAAGYRN